MKLLSSIVVASALAISTQAMAGDAGAGKAAYAAKGCIGSLASSCITGHGLGGNCQRRSDNNRR